MVNCSYLTTNHNCAWRNATKIAHIRSLCKNQTDRPEPKKRILSTFFI